MKITQRNLFIFQHAVSRALFDKACRYRNVLKRRKWFEYAYSLQDCKTFESFKQCFENIALDNEAKKVLDGYEV